MKHFSESERNRCREVEIGTSLQFNLMKDSSACLLDLDKFPGHSCLSQGTVMINPASTNHDSLLFRVAAPGHGQPPPGYNWFPNAGHSKPPSKVMFVMLRKSTHERPNLPRCKWQHVYKSIFSGSGYYWYYQLSPPMSRFSMNSRLQPAFLGYNLTLLLVTSSLKGDSSGGSVVAISFGSPWLSQGYG